MDKQLIDRLAKEAAANFVKTSEFDLMSIIKYLYDQGSGMFKGMDMKSMMPYMGMAAPLFKGVGAVAGIPGMAGMLDMFRGGENLQTLTAGGFGNYNQQAKPPAQPAGPGQVAPQATPAPTNAPIQPNTPEPAIQTPVNSTANAKVG